MRILFALTLFLSPLIAIAARVPSTPDVVAVLIYITLGAMLFTTIWLLLDYIAMPKALDRAIRIVTILLAMASIFLTLSGFL